MSPPLFGRVEMPDADVALLGHCSMPIPDRQIFSELHEQIGWRQERVFVWGKWHDQPRLIAWHGDAGKSYSYSGITVDPLPWTELLWELKQEVEKRTGASFNSVLLNLYRDQHDRMGFHSDDERELGPEPTIASLSYGAPRILKFKHRKRPDVGVVKLSLVEGSLLLMAGATQRHWSHGIDRQSRPCGPRINLTFRNIVA